MMHKSKITSATSP